MPRRVELSHLLEQAELLHIGKSMLTQIPAEDAFAEGVMRRAMVYRGIKACVEIFHGFRTGGFGLRRAENKPGAQVPAHRAFEHLPAVKSSDPGQEASTRLRPETESPGVRGFHSASAFPYSNPERLMRRSGG